MPDDFATLLARARVGDHEATRQIAELYQTKVRIVARVNLGPALRPYLDSQDLLQSVHRSLMVGLRNDKFDISSPEKLIGLTLTMVRRKIARQWRHLRRQMRPSAASLDGDGSIAPLLTSISAPQDDPAKAAEFRNGVERLCRNLDEVEHRIVDLRLQGFSAPEIAEQLGMTSVNIRVRMTRLRQRLVAAGVLDDWL